MSSNELTAAVTSSYGDVTDAPRTQRHLWSLHKDALCCGVDLTRWVWGGLFHGPANHSLGRQSDIWTSPCPRSCWFLSLTVLGRSLTWNCCVSTPLLLKHWFLLTLEL